MKSCLKGALAVVVLTFVLILPAYPADDAPATRQFTVYPIGTVQKDGDRTVIVLDKKYQPGLLGLEDYSHLYVFYWFDQNDTPEQRAILQIRSRRKPENPLKGVFAARSPVRPNLIAMTLCKIVSVKDNVIEVDDIDAFADTPVIDLKPYIPNYDDVENASVPEWIKKATGTDDT